MRKWVKKMALAIVKSLMYLKPVFNQRLIVFIMVTCKIVCSVGLYIQIY